ncbi:Kunitz/Bovine pancreatic trypsin inhibitor domain protein [Ostertagia ostertagi]
MTNKKWTAETKRNSEYTAVLAKKHCEIDAYNKDDNGRCYLPKVEGPLRCDQPQAKYWYDYNTKQCAAVLTFCKDVGPFATTAAPAPQPPQPPRNATEVESAEVDHEVVAHPIIDERPTPGQRYDDRPRQPMPTIEEVCRSTPRLRPLNLRDVYYMSGVAETSIVSVLKKNIESIRSATTTTGIRVHLQQPTLSDHVTGAGAATTASRATAARLRQSPSFSHGNLAICHSTSANVKARLTVGIMRWRLAHALSSSTPDVLVTRTDSLLGRSVESTCVRQPESHPDAASQGEISVCDEAKETGPCTNFVTKWYYNKADGTCNRFHYGGCEGTRNRFDNEQSCKAACANHQAGKK